MLKVYFNFDYKKATQALNFFAQKEGGTINKMKALKLVYFADRYHLRKYGRPITKDDYWAMPLGPVPSGTRDISHLKDEYLDKREVSYAKEYITCTLYRLSSKKPVAEVIFSDSDLEALNFAWTTFGKFNNFQLARVTHRYPEWDRHKDALKSNSRIHMHLEDFLNDPRQPDFNKCFELSDKMRKERLEQLKELTEISSLWS